jgi:hypothetical protein
MSGVSISDMHNFVENMDGSDLQMSSTIGNIVELGGEDLGDDLGIGLLSNNRSSSSSSSSSSSRPVFQEISSMEPIGDIGISSMDPLEPISLDIPSSNAMPSFPEISVNKSSSSSSSSSFSTPFSNEQTATGPSNTFSAVSRMNPEEEKKKKADLINKLNRLESKGYTLTHRFTMDNSMEEVQQEYERLVDAKNLEASIRFQRQCTMFAVTGIEMLNNKFNPFDWELDGWSESVHENIDDMDEVFEELYDKYKTRGNMPPEMKLVMSLVGSGFMFHMSNSYFRSKTASMSNDPMDLLRNNPQLAKQFAAAAAQQAGPGFGNFMGAAMGIPQGGMPQMGQMPQMPMNNPAGAFYQASNSVNNPPPAPQMPQSMAAAPSVSAPRREMKGPSGVDDILKTFQEVRAAEVDAFPQVMPTPIFTQQPAVQAIQEINSIHSTPMSDLSTDTTRTAGGTAQRRGGRRKAAVPVGNTMTLNL